VSTRIGEAEVSAHGPHPSADRFVVSRIFLIRDSQLIDIWRNRRQQRLRRRPEYGKSGARLRSFARPSASATRAATVVLRLRVPNDLPGPVCSWCFCGMLKAVAWH
jgi:hypothetical protein